MSPLEAQDLLGAVGAGWIAIIVEGIYGALPRLAKGSRILLSIGVGVCWSFLVAYSVAGDYRLAPIHGLLVGLAAANPRAVVQWSQRNGTRPDQPVDQTPEP